MVHLKDPMKENLLVDWMVQKWDIILVAKKELKLDTRLDDW
jgi:hypothetical protein